MLRKKNKVIVIYGPTSSGKTDLSISLAKKHNGEVVSADSRQVYQGLDISTGKVTPNEAQGINHHLIDIKHPNQIYSVYDWHQDALMAISDILKKNKLPIIAGGTGQYISALINNHSFPMVPPNQKLREDLGQQSLEQLLALINQNWPKASTESIDLKNKQKVIRAIEILSKTNHLEPLTANPSHYEFELIILLPDKCLLKEQIKQRTLARIKSGLVEEINSVHHKMNVSWERLEKIGFDQKLASLYLQNKLSYENFIEQLLTANWQYAKRQFTWAKTQLIKKPT